MDNKKTFTVPSLDDYGILCKDVIKALERTNILVLEGGLGAGKTTFTKKLVRAIGSTDEVSSPTFSLINEYTYSIGTIYHMDMYRLKSLDEAIDIGIEEYLDSGHICIIEWPELIQPLIDHCLHLKFISVVNDERQIVLTELG